MKKCNKCNTLKSVDAFLERGDMCKLCFCAYQREWRLKNPEKHKAIKTRTYLKNRERVIAKTTDYIKKNPEIKALSQKNYRAKFPNKQKAHSIVSELIRSGRLTKQPCRVCGSENKIHAHHSDYSKPLEIEWLCAPHHAAWHRIFEAVNHG